MVVARPLQSNKSLLLAMPPPGMDMMQNDFIVPDPGYKIPSNLWDLNIAQCVHAPSPLATFMLEAYAVLQVL